MHVFGTETHMTAIVGMALGKREVPKDVGFDSNAAANMFFTAQDKVRPKALNMFSLKLYLLVCIIVQANAIVPAGSTVETCSALFWIIFFSIHFSFPVNVVIIIIVLGIGK